MPSIVARRPAAFNLVRSGKISRRGSRSTTVGKMRYSTGEMRKGIGDAMSELLCRVAAADTVNGFVDRERAHAEEILHRSGVGFLRRSDGRILIQQRNPSKRIFPNCYGCSSAFHVTLGETHAQAAVRELREETGVSSVVHWVGKFTHHDPREPQIVAVFTASSDAPIQVAPSESYGCEFRTGTEVAATRYTRFGALSVIAAVNVGEEGARVAAARGLQSGTHVGDTEHAVSASPGSEVEVEGLYPGQKLPALDSPHRVVIGGGKPPWSHPMHEIDSLRWVSVLPSERG